MGKRPEGVIRKVDAEEEETREKERKKLGRNSERHFVLKWEGQRMFLL
jgi:hypothetical protein